MRVLAGLVLLLWAAPGFAAYSGLMLIPTADVLAPGEVCVDYYCDGDFPVGGGIGAAVVESQYGVGRRAEVGLDFDLTKGADTIPVLNGKVLLCPADRGLGLALGVYNVGEGVSPISYLVATRELGGYCRVHLGVQRTPEQEMQTLAGAEYCFEGRLSLAAEYLAGEENSSMISAYYQFTDDWGAAFGWGVPNDRESDNWWAINVACTWPAGD